VDPARRVHRRRDDRLDRAAADEASFQRLLADETRFVLDRAGEAHERCDAVERADRLGQASLSGPGMARVALQLPHAIELLALPERDRVPAGVPVRERDDRREAGGTGDVAARSSRPREAIVFLDGVRGPLRSFVDGTLTDHKAAGIADELA